MPAPQNKMLFPATVVVLALVIVVYVVFFSRVTPPDFASLEAGSERKEAFISYFAPIVDEKNADILEDRAHITSVCDAGNGIGSALEAYTARYRVDEALTQDEEVCEILLRRVDIVPASLALAQAANESGWGTSRFAQQGNNFFGQWCFKPGCGLVPNDRDSGKGHEVADFRSPADSVESYMLNLNRHDAYRSLRAMRQKMRDKDQTISGVTLTNGLNKYSERGAEYGEELRATIRFNKLDEFDAPTRSEEAPR